MFSLHYTTVYTTLQFTLHYSLHYTTVYTTLQLTLQYTVYTVHLPQVPLTKQTPCQLEAKWPSIVENQAKKASLRQPEEAEDDRITVKVAKMMMMMLTGCQDRGPRLFQPAPGVHRVRVRVSPRPQVPRVRPGQTHEELLHSQVLCSGLSCRLSVLCLLSLFSCPELL